jgi:hypothetical protein
MRLSVREKLLFLEALSWLILAKLALVFLPFKRILPLLKQKKPSGEKTADLVNIRDAIARAANITPWQNTCLTRSIAVRRMLKQRKIHSRLAIGMGHDENGKLLMHAWITANNIDIISNDEEFKELYLFE